MVLLTKARAAVLVGAWAFATRVNAQGYYFQNQSDSCSGLGFQYLGCFTAPNSVDPFQFTPGVPTTRGGSNDPSQSYILFDNNDHTNATTDPNYCSLFCRAHGYKYTGLYNQGCTCGSSLSDGYKTLTPAGSEAPCDVNKCSGDPTEGCGNGNAIRIFVDTSFQKEETLVAAPVSDLAAGYQKLGCFYGSNGGPTFPGPAFYQKTFGSAGQCAAFCADFKLPYMREVRDTSSRWVMKYIPQTKEYTNPSVVSVASVVPTLESVSGLIMIALISCARKSAQMVQGKSSFTEQMLIDMANTVQRLY